MRSGRPGYVRRTVAQEGEALAKKSPEAYNYDRNAGYGMMELLATRRGTVSLAAVGWHRLGNAQRCNNKGRQQQASTPEWPEAMVYFKARACKIYIYAMCTRPSFLVKGMCCGAS